MFCISDQAKRSRMEAGRHGMIFQHPVVAPLGSPGVPLQQLMPTAQGRSAAVSGATPPTLTPPYPWFKCCWRPKVTNAAAVSETHPPVSSLDDQRFKSFLRAREDPAEAPDGSSDGGGDSPVRHASRSFMISTCRVFSFFISFFHPDLSKPRSSIQLV